MYAGHVGGRYLVLLVHRSLDEEEQHLRVVPQEMQPQLDVLRTMRSWILSLLS